MKAASVTRMLASALSIVSYVLLTHGRPVEGVSVNLVVQGLLVPFALQTGAYDMVTLSGVFGVINLQTLFSHL
jgi:hypothetical protein